MEDQTEHDEHWTCHPGDLCNDINLDLNAVRLKQDQFFEVRTTV